MYKFAKLPHWRKRSKATWGSTEPTSSNCVSNLEAIAHFWDTYLVQNIASPIGEPRISKWGTLDFFFPDGNILRSLKLNSSYFAALIKRPYMYVALHFWVIESALKTASLGQVITLSSRYHELKSRLEKPSSVTIPDTRTCSTKQNNKGLSGSPCWTPTSELMVPK